jgi:hypothetical protein
MGEFPSEYEPTIFEVRSLSGSCKVEGTDAPYDYAELRRRDQARWEGGSVGALGYRVRFLVHFPLLFLLVATAQWTDYLCPDCHAQRSRRIRGLSFFPFSLLSFFFCGGKDVVCQRPPTLFHIPLTRPFSFSPLPSFPFDFLVRSHHHPHLFSPPTFHPNSASAPSRTRNPT